MQKNTEYSQSFDGYDNEQAETHAIESAADNFANQDLEDIEEHYDDNLDQEPSENTKVEVKNKKPEKDIDITNHDLRLINAYFQEVSTEPLLTPQEESLVAAKIKSCDTKAKEVKNVLETTLGIRLDYDLKIM